MATSSAWAFPIGEKPASAATPAAKKPVAKPSMQEVAAVAKKRVRPSRAKPKAVTPVAAPRKATVKAKQPTLASLKKEAAKLKNEAVAADIRIENDAKKIKAGKPSSLPRKRIVVASPPDVKLSLCAANEIQGMLNEVAAIIAGLSVKTFKRLSIRGPLVDELEGGAAMVRDAIAAAK